MKDLTNNGEKFMTGREIREVLNISRRAFERSVNKLFPGKLENGKTTYYNECEATKIKQDIEKHHNSNLGGTAQVIKSQKERNEIVLEAIQILIEDKEKLQQENQALKQDNARMAPKEIVHDQLVDSVSLESIRVIADSLKVGQNNFFEMLRNDGIMFYEYVDGRKFNIPKSEYIKQGYFQVKRKIFFDVEGKCRESVKAMVTGKGRAWLTKKYGTK